MDLSVAIILYVMKKYTNSFDEESFNGPPGLFPCLEIGSRLTVTPEVWQWSR